LADNSNRHASIHCRSGYIESFLSAEGGPLRQLLRRPLPQIAGLC
jgi:hypothetical protein